jgi:hypothetical protein
MEQETKKSLGVSFRIIATTVGILVAVVAINYVIFATGYREDAEKAMVQKAAAFTAVADEAKNHASKLIQNESIAVEELFAELERARLQGRRLHPDPRVRDHPRRRRLDDRREGRGPRGHRVRRPGVRGPQPRQRARARIVPRRAAHRPPQAGHERGRRGRQPDQQGNQRPALHAGDQARRLLHGLPRRARQVRPRRGRQGPARLRHGVVGHRRHARRVRDRRAARAHR